MIKLLPNSTEVYRREWRNIPEHGRLSVMQTVKGGRTHKQQGDDEGSVNTRYTVCGELITETSVGSVRAVTCPRCQVAMRQWVESIDNESRVPA